VRFFAFVFSIVVHENAHGLTANHFGDPTARDLGRITMNPLPHVDPLGSVLLPLVSLLTGVRLIGWAKPVPVNSANLRNPVVDNAYVAMAGPFSNFLLALAAAILWIVVAVAFANIPALAAHGERSHMFFNTLCYCFIEVNCTLAIFNLLPIPPLDGHWILMRYLPPGPREALASIGPWGFFILLGLMWTGILGRIIGPPILVAISLYHLLVNSVANLF
jgi:Zn-dependent protease